MKIQVKVENVSFDPTSQMGVVVLKEMEGERVLPIWIGIFEAQAIMMKLKNTPFPRPLTYDLFSNILNQAGINVEYVLVSAIKDNTYLAQIHLLKDTEKLIVDSRPSDAIALALRVSCSIYISEEIAARTQEKKEFEEQIKSEIYKQYLMNLGEDELKKA